MQLCHVQSCSELNHPPHSPSTTARPVSSYNTQRGEEKEGQRGRRGEGRQGLCNGVLWIYRYMVNVYQTIVLVCGWYLGVGEVLGPHVPHAAGEVTTAEVVLTQHNNTRSSQVRTTAHTQAALYESRIT